MTSNKSNGKPVLRHILNIWSMVGYPSPKKEWSLERKLKAAKDAGFDGFTTQLTAAHADLGDKLGLMRVGYFASSRPADFEKLLGEQKRFGAEHINVQLGDHDTPTAQAVAMAKRLMSLGRKIGVQPAVEVHRDTCTETPEKTFALADAFKKQTGGVLPMTWDYSHLGVVKHLSPPYWKRLGVRLDLVRPAQQFHFRPFNGHHCQVPVTDGHGHFTPEFLDYRPLVEEVMRAWLKSAPPGREMFAVPEMGPAGSGYNLHCLPNSWEDAKILREEIQKRWDRASKG